MSKILIIDDDVDTCALLSAYLQKKAFKRKLPFVEIMDYKRSGLSISM